MKNSILTGILAFIFNGAFAHEGMWIPALLDAVYNDMQGMGLKVSQEDLYSINHSSLKDAIVLFDGGCTAEVVSGQGLVFTNHHCGFDYIQFHSTLEHDYLTDGFWAMNKSEELLCNGLTATFIVRMDDITEQIFSGIDENTSAEEMAKIKAQNKNQIEADAKMNGQEGVVRAFNYGNQYFLIITKTYKDIRLVGAPPSAIGKFGGDTDNWVWPRHTGDFSVFRIYANNNNEPAEISDNNQPYKPNYVLPISLDGMHEGDFAMVYGFPGRTDHFLSSYAVDYVINKSNPMRIDMRKTSLGIIDRRMAESDKIRIQYAAKQSGISNAYKKWVGQNMGLEKFQALKEKQVREKDFSNQVIIKKLPPYQKLLPDIEKLYTEYENVNLARDGFVEYLYYGPEVFAFAHDFIDYVEQYDDLVKKGVAAEKKEALMASAKLFYKDFDLETEKLLFAAMTPKYSKYVDHNFGPSAFDTYLYKNKVDVWGNAASAIYSKSIFSDSSRFYSALSKFNPKMKSKLTKDAVYAISKSLFDTYNGSIKPKSVEFNSKLEPLMAAYIKAQHELYPKREYWTDANGTLRISFGMVEGSTPRDGMTYTYFTTSDGILEKSHEGNPDFEIPDRLKELLEGRQFAGYGENGELRVAFTSSNHTTGGNSGSPAINANGQLVGINFDRSWESTMSDIYYSPKICRNIMVDIRYVLWVIDIYAKAGYLLGEMQLIHMSPEKAESR